MIIDQKKDGLMSNEWSGATSVIQTNSTRFVSFFTIEIEIDYSSNQVREEENKNEKNPLLKILILFHPYGICNDGDSNPDLEHGKLEFYP